MLNRKQLAQLRASRPVGVNRVKKAIELADTTQEALAVAIGSSQSHVTEIANGNYSKLPLETARSFAEYFGCAIEDLFPAREGAVA